MLTFDRLTAKDVPLAWGYNNDEGTGKPRFTVYFTPRYSGDTAITTDDIGALLKNERLRLQSELKLDEYEFKSLVDRIKRNEPSDPAWDRTLKRAWLELNKAVDAKLRREIEFDRSENIWLKVAFDVDRDRVNSIVGVFGASGAGKSWSIQETILRFPALALVPRVHLFGSVGETDPSYDKLRHHLAERFEYKKPRDMTDDDLRAKNYERKSVIVFDDIDSISDSRVRRATQHFRDTLFEIARHRSLTLFASVHLFHSYRATAKIRNSSRFFFIFPRSVPKVLLDILDKTFSMKRQRRQALLKKVQEDGRLCVVSMKHPMFVCSAKRLILL